MILQFGKHKGRDIRDVPVEYVEYILGQAEKTIIACREELQRCEQSEQATMPMIDRIVTVGFRALARQHHPDAGGETSNMQDLNAAHEALRELLRPMESLRGGR
jgi:hypothetical protein